MLVKFLLHNRSTILYAISLAALLLLMKVLEWRMVVMDHTFELYAGIIAILFTGLGIWLANKVSRPKPLTVIVEKQVYVKGGEFVQNQNELALTCLSKRELEVLQLMADGLSNQQIAEHLFVSLNTIKTHASKIFEKLEVRRRTQAIETARRLSLIP